MTTFIVPATLPEVLTGFGGDAEQLHLAGWRIAIRTYLLTAPSKGGKPIGHSSTTKGKDTAPKSEQFPMSFRSFAELNIHGFEHQGTVAGYWHIADAAIKAGVLTKPGLNHGVEIPDVSWHEFRGDYAVAKSVVDTVLPTATPTEKAAAVVEAVKPTKPKIKMTDATAIKVADAAVTKVKKAIGTALVNEAQAHPKVAAYLAKYPKVVKSSTEKGVDAAIKAALASDTPLTDHTDAAVDVAVGWANKVTDVAGKVVAKQAVEAEEHSKQPGWAVMAITNDAVKVTKLVTRLVKMMSKSIDQPGVREGLNAHELIDDIDKMSNALNLARHMLVSQEIDWDTELSQLNEDPPHPIKEDE